MANRGRAKRGLDPNPRREPSSVRSTLVQETAIAPVTSRWLKPLYFLLGIGSLTVGVIGIFLPLVPTTGPLLIAAFAFARSSERLHSWLMNHPRLGRFIRDFQQGRGIPLPTKILAVVAMTASFTYAAGWVLTHPLARIAVVTVWVWAIWYVLHFPTTRPE